MVQLSGKGVIGKVRGSSNPVLPSQLKRSLSSLRQHEKFPEVLVATREESKSSHCNSRNTVTQGPCRVGTGESGLVLSEEGNPGGLSSPTSIAVAPCREIPSRQKAAGKSERELGTSCYSVGK